MALIRHRPAQIRAGVRHCAPRRAGLARWKSTWPDLPLPIEVQSYSPEVNLVKGKGKEREHATTQDRTALIEAILLDVEKGIEQSKEWDDTNARYPNLKPKQVSLVTLLKEVVRRLDKAKAGLSASELLMLHATILRADRQLGDSRRFDRSAVAYTFMLKYAFRLRDARALKQVAKEALTWQHNRTTKVPSERRTPRFIHPRVAAADDLPRLIRNLFVSLNIEQGVRIKDTRGYIASGVQLPSSKARIQPGDDAMIVSKIFRQRLSNFRLARDKEGLACIETSKEPTRSPYPLTHQSSRLRWLNRMAARGKIDKVIDQLPVSEDQKVGQPLLSAPETTMEATTPAGASTSSATAAASSASALTQSTAKDMVIATKKEEDWISDLLSGPRGSQTHALQVAAIRNGLSRWQVKLLRRVKSREKMVSLFQQFKLTQSGSTSTTTEAVKELFPTWLVLSLLRLQIERGDVQRAEKILQVYLQSLAGSHKNQELVDVIPVNAARVHAVTSPMTPPNGSSLLNALLRTHLNSGAKDCFEGMVRAVHKWAFQAKKFTQCVLMKKIEMQKIPHIPEYAGCLIPNQETVLILLEALEKRKLRYSLGKALVEQMWYRWGIVGLHDERVSEALVEPQRHQALEMPLQAFTRLLRWASKEVREDRRRKKISEILELEKKWREKAFGSNQSTFQGASVEQKLAWKQVVRSTQRDAWEGQHEEEDDQSPTMYFTSNQ